MKATGPAWKIEPDSGAAKIHEAPATGGWLRKSAPHGLALVCWLLSLILFLNPLRGLGALALRDEHSVHILLVPLISGLLLYLQRRRIFRATRFCPAAGAAALGTVAVLWFAFSTPLLSESSVERLPIAAGLIGSAWIAGFLLFYGPRSVRAAAFPLILLALMIPLPGVVADRAISLLQSGSADACYALFRLVRIPFVRHGFLFSLPGVDIEVAQQCSGINSAMSLFLTGLLAQHVLLQGVWKKICFVLLILPIAILKNALRIVVIAWLGVYVNPGFFHGTLHRRGGLPFSLLALALMGVLLWLLRRGYSPATEPDSSPQVSSEAA